MIYWADKSQSFCTISDNKCHEPSAIWAHLMPVINLVKTSTPQVKTIHFFSDGPSTQYRQKKNFYALHFFTKELGFECCTWNFSESGHGKGVADGIGGAVKRTLDKQVAYGQDVTDGTKTFQILTSLVKSNIKYFYIENREIDKIAHKIPNNLKAVAGTLVIHQVICHAQALYINHRVLSCFCCLDTHEVCDCYLLKKHTFVRTETKCVPSEPISTSFYDKDQNLHSAHSLDCAKTSAITSVNQAQYPPKVEQLPVDTVRDWPIIFVSSDPLSDSDSLKDLPSTDLITDCAIIPTSPHLTSASISIFDVSSPDLVTDNEVASTSVDLTSGQSYSITTASSNHNKDCANISKFSQSIISNVNIVSPDIVTDNLAQNSSASLCPPPSKTIDITKDSDLTRSNYKRPNTLKAHLNKKNKENVSRNANSSIRTVISRCIACTLCKQKVPFNSKDLIKCMACKKRYCITCTEGECFFDYICKECFGEES